jgi:hypothetical protein
VHYSIALQETTRGLVATWRMFWRDPRAAALFENSYAGAIRSYWAIVIILPIYLLTIAIEYGVPSDNYGNFGKLAAQAGLPGAALAEFSIFALCWFVAWPLVVDRLAPLLNCNKNFFRYVAAYNWMHVPYALVGLLFWTGMMSGIIHDGNIAIASFSLLGLLWTYHWFILRHALGLNGGYAALLVALEFILSAMLKDFAINAAL